MSETRTVDKYYEEDPQKEWDRLFRDTYHRLEFDTTIKFLRKYLPKRGLILDAGGGPGRYTIELGKLGHEIILLDYTKELLELAKRKIKEEGIEGKVKDIVHGSITDLSLFKNDCFDSVICLGGPLSHVKGKSKRNKAVCELKRVCKPGGYIFLSVIGRLAVLESAPRYFHDEIENIKRFKTMWEKGDDDNFRGVYAHFFLPEELDELFNSNSIRIVERVGLEGLASGSKEGINELGRRSSKAWKNWLESHYSLCTNPAVFALSSHMMIIGQK